LNSKAAKRLRRSVYGDLSTKSEYLRNTEKPYEGVIKNVGVRAKYLEMKKLYSTIKQERGAF